MGNYQENRTKSVLCFIGSKIGPQGCRQLALAKCSNLKQLNLWENRIGSEGCKYLAKGYWPCLQLLDLRKNLIGPEGCGYLINCKWPALKKLLLGENQLKGKGCKILGKGKWLCLQQLNLENNKISWRGCQFLRKANWPALLTLSLVDNQINVRGWRSLRKGKPGVMEKLDVSYNNLVSLSGLMKPPSQNQMSVEGWRNLKVIRLNNSDIESIQGLTQISCPILQQLYLQYNYLTKIDALLKISSRCLRIISIKANLFHQLSNFGYLPGTSLQQLRILARNQTKIINMEPLLKCRFKQGKNKISVNMNNLRKVEAMQKKYTGLRLCN